MRGELTLHAHARFIQNCFDVLTSRQFDSWLRNQLQEIQSVVNSRIYDEISFVIDRMQSFLSQSQGSKGKNRRQIMNYFMTSAYSENFFREP